MSIESKLEKRNKVRDEVKSIETEIKDDIKSKFKSVGIDIESVNIESSVTEFNIVVEESVEKNQITSIEDRLDSFEFSMIKPKISKRDNPVTVIYFQSTGK